MSSKSAVDLHVQSTMPYFGRSSTNTLFEDEEDDDPFYEIYNCHKVTFIESKLSQHIN